VRCAKLPVPLDRGGTVPGTVTLHVERVARPGDGGTVVVLAGGPGESASSLTSFLVQKLTPVTGGRDLVVFDQRGTGLSGALRCWAFSSQDIRNAHESAEVLRACAESIGPRRFFYTTNDSVEDIEALRAALGVEQITLFAVSYGTKVALAYAARYPDRVERLVLDSVVPPDGPDPFQRSSLAAAARILRDACRGGCRFTEDPVADLRALVARIDREGPLPAVEPASFFGAARHIRIGRADLIALLYAGDFMPAIRAFVPAAITAALRGRMSPLALLTGGGSPNFQAPARLFSMPTYVAATCEDATWPWSRDADPAARAEQARAAAAEIPDEAFAPFDRETVLGVGLIRTCRNWPTAPVSRALPAGPLPDVPALLLAGEADMRTPVADAAAVAAQFPRGRLLSVPWTGHATFSRNNACVRRALVAFFAGRPVQECRRRPNPFAPFSVEEMLALVRSGPLG
jgi:pimeloyl-ACP methyl ester carboxylesterase